MGLVDTAKCTVKDAADAAQRAVGKARGKAREIGIRRRMGSLADELGYVVVRQRDGEPGLDAEVERLVSEIRAAQAEIAALHED
jgi:hypothetical protein